MRKPSFSVLKPYRKRIFPGLHDLPFGLMYESHAFGSIRSYKLGATAHARDDHTAVLGALIGLGVIIRSGTQEVVCHVPDLTSTFPTFTPQRSDSRNSFRKFNTCSLQGVTTPISDCRYLSGPLRSERTISRHSRTSAGLNQLAPWS